MLKSLFLYTLLTLLGTQPAFADDFHLPKTQPEKQLHNLIKLAEENSIFYNLEQLTNTEKNNPYRSLLTKDYINSLAEEEKKALNMNCNGQYITGDQCGLEIDPITCSQDINNEYVYQTISATNSTATINYKWPTHSKPIATYFLIRKSDQWLLNGIICDDLKINANLN